MIQQKLKHIKQTLKKKPKNAEFDVNKNTHRTQNQ